MALVLPNAIAPGTLPDADQVQGNDQYLLDNLAGIKLLGKTTASTGTARTTAGTNTNTLSGSSESFSVAVPSVLKIDYSGAISYGISGTGKVSGSLGVLLDGAGVFVGAGFVDDRYGIDVPDSVRVTLPLAGTAVIGLTAGAHTIALQYTQTVNIGSIGTLADGVQGTGGYWSGIVVPVP